jgi:hypothetical protein
LITCFSPAYGHVFDLTPEKYDKKASNKTTAFVKVHKATASSGLHLSVVDEARRKKRRTIQNTVLSYKITKSAHLSKYFIRKLKAFRFI